MGTTIIYKLIKYGHFHSMNPELLHAAVKLKQAIIPPQLNIRQE